MRALVFGAGVIGCELAHVLCEKNDVTILSRGKWKENIDRNSLIIRHLVQMKTTVDRMKTIETLKPDDRYDLIFVVMQACQLPEAVSAIAVNASPHIVFVGNNVKVQETAMLASCSPVKKVIAFGFLRTAGRREDGKVISIHAGVGMTLGGLASPLPKEFQDKLNAAFSETVCRLTWEGRMDAWLKCHASCVLPMVYACYITGGRLSKAAHRLRKAIMDADAEGYAALQKLGYPILPEGDEKWFSGARRLIMASIFFFIYKTLIGRLSVSDHAMRAFGEMKYLDSGLVELRKRADIPTPAWDKLRKESRIEER